VRLGQTSAVFFISRIGSSLLGFLATVYFARTLGSANLGVYFLVLALTSWLTIGAKAGIPMALIKRLSEGKDRNQFILSGVVLVAITTLSISVIVLLLRGRVNRYLGASFYQAVILLLCARVVYDVVGAVIQGDHQVHLKGILDVSQTIVRIGIQVGLVVVGFSVIGLLVGEILAFFSLALVGAITLQQYFSNQFSLELPERKHVRSLFDYSKYSWLERVKGSTYSLMDKLVLGFFVSSSLIGIYSICWNIAAVMSIFSKSISSSFFPEISKLSKESKEEEVVSHLKKTLMFAGLFVIPGFVGSIVVGEGVLNIYDEEFRQGYQILVILIGSTLVHSYYRQFINTMNAIDRPEMSFKIHMFFVVSNIMLNFALVYFYGWIGAAIATLASSIGGVIVAHRLLSRVFAFSIPWGEIGKQFVSAVIMGIATFGLLHIFGMWGIGRLRIFAVLPAVAFGGVVYFTVLLTVSKTFKRTVFENLPA